VTEKSPVDQGVNKLKAINRQPRASPRSLKHGGKLRASRLLSSCHAKGSLAFFEAIEIQYRYQAFYIWKD